MDTSLCAQIDEQKAAQAQLAHERAALLRLEKVKADQTKRVEALGAEAEAQERRALLIHLNLEAVDGAIGAVNGALAAGMDWGELEQMIKAEKRAGNPVAQLIASLALERNKVRRILCASPLRNFMLSCLQPVFSFGKFRVSYMLRVSLRRPPCPHSSEVCLV
jgi:hypothetical protein